MVMFNSYIKLPEGTSSNGSCMINAWAPNGTKPGGDILAIRVSELTAKVPLMVWRLQITDSSSAPTCDGGARLIPLQLVMEI